MRCAHGRSNAPVQPAIEKGADERQACITLYLPKSTESVHDSAQQSPVPPD